MKEISELNLVEEARYTNDHEYAIVEDAGDGVVRVGLSDYAQDQLGDIVFVELPGEGDSFDAGAEFGTVESVKAVAELYMPISGEVVAVNTSLADAPELVNTDPYTEGWMMRVKPRDAEELSKLLTRDDYRRMLEGLE